MGLDLKLFVGNVPEEFICVVCKKVLLNPVECLCTHLFCSKCLNHRLETEDTSTCPACSAPLDRDKIHPPSEDLRVRMLGLPVRCSHDCGKVSALGLLPDHIALECPHAPEVCPNAAYGCKKKVMRKELQEHAELECDWRPVDCEACGKRTAYWQLFTHQKQKRCVEIKLRQQLIKAVRINTVAIKQHREYLERQRFLVEQELRQQHLKHRRFATTAICSPQKSECSSDTSDPDRPPLFEYDVNHATLPEVLMTSQHDSVDRRFGTSRMDYYNTPSPSRNEMHVLTCKNCRKEFRENINFPNSCRWHHGPIVRLFGGACFFCGRLDYQKGCMMGYHEA